MATDQAAEQDMHAFRTCRPSGRAGLQDVQAFRTAVTGLQLEDVACDGANTTLLCDIFTGQPRPVFPTGNL